jgi:hypothetical protein
MKTVDIRKFKANLIRHPKQLQADSKLMVTEQGRCLATMSPVETRAKVDWARRIVAEGRARWNGGKPVGSVRPAPVALDRTVSAAVLEDRG